MAITESLFSVNNFNKPTVLTGNKAKVTLITRLILLEPGKILGMPIEAGIGLRSRYRYANEDELSSLETEIQNQISIYIPDAQGAEVTCVLRKSSSLGDRNILMIGIRIGEEIYAIGTDGENVYQSEDDNNLSTISLQSLLSE